MIWILGWVAAVVLLIAFIWCATKGGCRDRD